MVLVLPVGHIKKLGARHAHPLSVLEQSLYVGGAFYVLFPPKTPCLQESSLQSLHLVRLALSAYIRLLLVRNGQLPAALCAPPFENEASAASLHTGAETKLSIAFYFARLVCA